MQALAQFPSQGDLVKFTYDALGINPSKSDIFLDLKIKNQSFQKRLHRSLQQKHHKKLHRLAIEDGSNYLENFSNLVQDLEHKITDIFPSYQLQKSILDTLQELFQCYLSTVIDEHTYLEKRKSFEFIIFSTLLPRLPISILKHQERYADFFQQTSAPKDFYWFLGVEDQTPLSYIMQWIYDSENLTYKYFHRLNADLLQNFEYEEQEKDLYNVHNWLNNKSLPAFSDLKTVFERAFQSHVLSKKRQEGYLFFLLIARFCTYCIQEIKKNYGNDFVKLIVIKLKTYLDAIFQDFNLYKQRFETNKILIKGVIFHIETQVYIEAHYSKNNESSVNILEERAHNTVKNFIDALSEQQITLAKYLQETSDTKFLKYQNKIEKNYIFSFCRLTNLELFNRPHNELYIPNILNYIQGYDDVLNNKVSLDQWIKEYQSCHNDIIYPWLEQWIRGVLLFKQNDIADALNFMDSAFETIRYAAGKHQERFLEDYLLISLANPKGYKSFKQAYKWGTFMNHFGGLKPLFNLESDEEIKQLYLAKKNASKAFEKMKNNMDMKTLAKMVFHWRYDQD